MIANPKRDENVWDNTVRFVAFRVPFQDLPPDLMAVAFQEINEATERRQTPEYRVTSKTQQELWLEGAEEPKEESDQYGIDAETDPSQVPYAGNKLGSKYLRAPDIFFILEKGKGKLVRLGDIAEVRFSIKTGANEFFYLEPVGRTVKEVAELREQDPMTPVRVKNGAGWEGEIEAAWLRPVIKSPREIKTLRVRLEDLRYLVFMPPEDVREAIDGKQTPSLSRYLKASAYIRWGEERGYPQRPTCKSRWWWDFPKNESAVKIPMLFRERYFAPMSSAYCDAQLYDVIKQLSTSLTVPFAPSLRNWAFPSAESAVATIPSTPTSMSVLKSSPWSR